ncbi:Hsp20/alpha crystallin family protein [Sulfuricella sp.]|uniref:Hsp20/alpha crystallin family protein n=1 Tax=Sulfuricella sp. TaxID=2099377 RepID=UPI002C1A53DE|nr:Hsp20/alpha crystallin family protein [Sulfuricella sp.]HUX64920.1 Hsp20/alpha crystallin family protein [Sulfuricella sp.]
MANITRYDPFDVTLDPFDDLFRGFLRPVRFEGQTQQMQIKMDVKEDDKAYNVHAEIPGVKKEDIHVTIAGNQVSISAEVKKEKEEKEGEKVLRSERYYGKVYRSFSLGQDVDEATATAKYNEGVLNLTLPKKATSSAKKLSIQ